MASRPASRDEFEVAIVCALPLEYDAACLAFDEFWDNDGDVYGKAPNDPNIYTTGSIQSLNVVLVLLPGMRKVNAANTVSSLRSSYSGIRLAILTGICGAVPSQGNEIILGDVIISKRVVQYDFGRQRTGSYARIQLKTTLGDPLQVFAPFCPFSRLLGPSIFFLIRPPKFFRTCGNRAASNKRNRIRYDRPPTIEDKLFAADYIHKHRDSRCNDCTTHACDVARSASYENLSCENGGLIPRKRLSEMKGELADGEDQSTQVLHAGAIESPYTINTSTMLPLKFKPYAMCKILPISVILPLFPLFRRG
ncbi:uncharacterized protein LY79DRAFT_39668, partial [Colletotrichum navitas]